MSPPWRSEVIVRLGSRAATAASASSGQGALRWRAGGRPAASLAQLVGALRARDGTPASADRPLRVRLWLTEELAYLDLLPALGSWRGRDARAAERFAAALGTTELQVGTSLLPGGRAWLAAAVETSRLRQWTDTLAAAGARLAGVELALPHDLRAAQREAGRGDALLGLVRDEGVQLVRWSRGRPMQLAWERCDTHDGDALALRLQSFQHRHGACSQVLLHAPDRADTTMLAALARAPGWRLVAGDPVQSCPPASQPAPARAELAA